MSGPSIGSLFSGYSGLEMGVQAVLGGEAVWHSEIDPGACKILAHRYPGVPNLGDITAVDWAAVEPVDVLTGGFPCQDVSAAGKRAGLHSDTRSGLWAQMVRAIDELHPPLVIAENVRGILSACALSELEPCPRCLGDESQPHRPVLRAAGRVVGDMADLGYVGRWGGLPAAAVGAPHARYREFFVAWPATDADHAGRREHSRPVAVRPEQPAAECGGDTVPDAQGHGRHEGRAKPARLVRGSDAALSGDVAADADRDGLGRLEELHGVPRTGREGGGDGHDADRLAVAPGGVAWGQYGQAVARWERRLGRPAPPPTERGKNAQPRLSPAFVEWMMGLPAGWVTDVPGLTRNEMLKALGNGVVPQQAAQALRMLLPDVQAVAA